MSSRFRIEKLQRGHAIDSFDCGRDALNRFLIGHALQNQQASGSQTYVALAGGELFDFVAWPSDAYHLFRLLKDIRGLLKG